MTSGIPLLSEIAKKPVSTRSRVAGARRSPRVVFGGKAMQIVKGNEITMTLRLWLSICGLWLGSPALFAQYTLEYSTNGNDIILTDYTGAPVNVAVPYFVTSIGEGAFSFCTNLINITIGDSVTNIENYAFQESSLVNVNIPNSVTSIGNWAFSSCLSLTNVIIGSSVTNIGYDDSAFNGCTSLANILVNSNNPAFSSVNGVLFNQNQTTLLQYPGGRTGSYTIPGTVTTIGNVPFFNSLNLTSVIIPRSVTRIGDEAFYGCLNLAGVFFQGNAPTEYLSAFGSTSARAYYLQGTTGWNSFSANTGVPAVLWDPLIQTGGSSPGISNNQFGFTIINGSTTNIPIAVVTCTNLAAPIWTPITNLMLTTSFHFSDPAWTNYPVQFYSIGFP